MTFDFDPDLSSIGRSQSEDRHFGPLRWSDYAAYVNQELAANRAAELGIPEDEYLKGAIVNEVAGKIISKYRPDLSTQERKIFSSGDGFTGT